MGEAGRQTHSARFKANLGLEALRGVKTVDQIAQEHSLHPVQVGQWNQRINENAGVLFAGKRGPKVVDEPADQERLCREFGWLKRAADSLEKKSEISLWKNDASGAIRGYDAGRKS